MGKNNRRPRLVWLSALFVVYSVSFVYENILNAKQVGEIAQLRAQVQTMNDQASSSSRQQNTQGVRMRPPTLSEIDQRVQLMNSPDSIAYTYLMFGRSMSRSAPNIIPEVINRVSRLEGINMLEKQSYIADLYAQLGQNDRAYALMSAIRVDELEALKGAQIQQEQMAKVRFQMRAKNDELKQIASQLSTTQRFGLVGFIVLFAVNY